MSNNSKPFIPPPPGTIRGPYICGKGTDPQGGVQYLVRRADGRWAYFIRERSRQAECFHEAEELSLKIKNEIQQCATD